MELAKIWSQLSLFVGLLICWTKALPLDMEAAQMAVMSGINMAMDTADKIKGEVGTSNELAIAGMEFKHSHHGSFGDVNSSDERRRRRRSANENEALPHEYRDKRSPCKAATRIRATTVASEIDEDIETAGNIKVNETGGRRKRSPTENDTDRYENDQYALDGVEQSQQFSEAIRQMLKNILDMISGVIEKIQKRISQPDSLNESELVASD